MAQREFDAVTTRLSKATLDTSAPQANVSVLKPATVPAVTASASRTAKAAVATMAGLLLALVALALLESRDRRVRDADDILHTLRQPVLATLQRRRTGSDRGTRHLLVNRSRPALVHERLHAAR